MKKREVTHTNFSGKILGIYESGSEAGRQLNIPRTKVNNVLKGRVKHYKGHYFKYTS